MITNRQNAIFPFVPPKIDFSLGGHLNLSQYWSKGERYAANGKSCLYHILKSFPKHDKILLPAYICKSVLKPIEKLGLIPVYYDINEIDLNGNPASMLEASKKYEAKICLVASLYGNPAALDQFENICIQNGILLIDDAAQSFGSSLNGRPVGTFGDAGFFSLSPGKATAGHMGGFFWSRFSYDFKRSNHDFVHFLKWIIFKYFRLNLDQMPFPETVFKIAMQVSGKLDAFGLWNDDIAGFEKVIVNSIVNAQILNRHQFRDRFHTLVRQNSVLNENFRILVSDSIGSHLHKVVLISKSHEISSRIRLHLKKFNIAYGDGYPAPKIASGNFPKALSLFGRVIELPIQDSQSKMDWLWQTLNAFQNSSPS